MLMPKRQTGRPYFQTSYYATYIPGRILSDSLLAELEALSNFALNVLFALYFPASIYVYVSLIRQISVRTSEPAGESGKRFRLPEAILAAVLISLLLRGISASVSRPSAQVDARDLLANLLLTFALVLFIVAFLRV